jgi:hypothetical protein
MKPMGGTATFSLRPAVPGVGASFPIRGANARCILRAVAQAESPGPLQ